ncbi:MAG: hypothetical protein PHQ62_00100 [Clostridia bacterium]|nr:hypothetical protein [Clostridia bacterium]
MKTIIFNFDTTYPIKLRDKVNEIVDHMTKKNHYVKDNKTKKQISTNSWNQICGIMNRIEDTLYYVNTLELGNYAHGHRSCFDFYEFIMHISVIIDSIKWLAKIFEIPQYLTDKIRLSNTCFARKGIKNIGCDEKFFDYIRSLVVAHPIETSRHPEYIPAKDIMHICPYIVPAGSAIMNLRKIKKKNFDYDVVIYVSSSANSNNKHVYIRVADFVKYVDKWLNFIKIIIKYIDKYNKKTDSDYKIQHIKEEKEFKTFTQYLNNLIRESEKRFDNAFALQELKYILLSKSSFPENNIYISKYKNAIKYCIHEYHSVLQDMNRNENAGLKYIKRNYSTNIVSLIYDPPTYDLDKYNDNMIYYAFEKTSYLDGKHSYNDEQWGRQQFEMHLYQIVKDMALKIDSRCSSQEYMLLLNTALYLKALTNDNLLNNNIPKTNEYRIIT